MSNASHSSHSSDTQLFDVIVIGSGGGSKITRPAANLGKSVAIIEKGKLGGTCLNHGCIPSKMLIHSADVMHEINHANRYNLTGTHTITPDFKALVEYVNHEIDHDSDSIEPAYLAHPNIHLFKGHAQFVDNYTIDVNGQRLTAPQIVIAAGCKAHIPPIKGLSGTPYWTYKEILRNTTLPKSLIIVGGGYIAVELGYFYSMMGCQVHYIVRSSFLSSQDDDVNHDFNAEFGHTATVHLGSVPNRVIYSEDTQTFTMLVSNANGDLIDIEAEKLLIATGFSPNTGDLGLETTDIELDDNGNIKVDEFLETSVKGIYAFGDIIGRHLFRHTANYEGEYVFNTHFASQSPKTQIHYPPIPYAVFTNPQIAGVGPSERDLSQRGISYIVGKNPYKSSAMGMALRSTSGFVKLLFDTTTRRLLGGVIIGPEAATMSHMIIAFVKMNATLDDLLDTIYVHPALPELIRNAARKAKIQFDELSLTR